MEIDTVVSEGEEPWLLYGRSAHGCRTAVLQFATRGTGQAEQVRRIHGFPQAHNAMFDGYTDNPV